MEIVVFWFGSALKCLNALCLLISLGVFNPSSKCVNDLLLLIPWVIDLSFKGLTICVFLKCHWALEQRFT
jgi:hypothetical protein